MSLWFALLLGIFLAVAVLIWAGVAIISPEIGLLILASLAFGLFAFRLLSAYTLVIAVADVFKEKGEVKDLQKLVQKSGKGEEELKALPLSAVLALVMAAMEPYRYTFYFGFILVLLFALAVNALPTFADLKVYMEALFWGSALTTFIVWAFENFAEASVADVAELEEKENPAEGGN